MAASTAATTPGTPTGQTGYGFGTFKGVFMPSILTILGVIMFLRFPWVLGSVGLTATLLIVTLSVAITLLTGLSIAAMATNMRIGGGGAYYMISRTLGLEVGAAVGLPLLLAQALGIAFYIAGFSETVVGYYPALSPTVVGVASLLVLTVLAYVSADLALKSQFVILTVAGAGCRAPAVAGARVRGDERPQSGNRHRVHDRPARDPPRRPQRDCPKILSMFFLTSYAVLNFSAGLEA